MASRFCISCSSVTSTRAPEAPTGWPIAIAPPLTLTLDGIPAEVLVDRAGLRREGLVGLDQIEIADVPAGLLQRGARGRDRPGAHDLGIDAGLAPGHDAAEHLLAFLGGLLGGHQHHRGGAVIDARGVAGGDGAVLLEGRPAAWPSHRAWRRGADIRRCRR